MIYIDIKYIGLVSVRLSHFKRKSDKLYNFRCPYCLDSKKRTTKTRGYFFKKDNDMFFKCHNCGRGATMYNFLKDQDPELSREYALERYNQGDTGHSNYPKPEKKEAFPVSVNPFQKKDDLDLPSIESLPDGHYVKDYVAFRQIPREFWTILYHASDFKALVDRLLPNNEHDLKRNDPRLVIPFMDKNGNVIALQGRSLLDPVVRYITIKLKDVPKIYGQERIDYTKMVYVVEGPIDSLFLPNCLAAAGSDLPDLSCDAIFVYDNEPRNKEIVQKISNLIDEGKTVCIWPNDVSEKDVNDMVSAGRDVKTLIDDNSVKGLKAKLKLGKWRRV